MWGVFGPVNWRLVPRFYEPSRTSNSTENAGMPGVEHATQLVCMCTCANTPARSFAIIDLKPCQSDVS